MELRLTDWLVDLLGVQSLSRFGGQQSPLQEIVDHLDLSDVDCNSFVRSTPRGYEAVSIVHVKDNLAVIPEDWQSGGISKLHPPPFALLIAHISL